MQIIDYNSAEFSLADIHILKELPSEDLRTIEQKCEWIKFDANDIILDPSDTDKHEVYFLVEGTVRIANDRDDSEEISLADLDAGSHFGELSAIDAQGRAARVRGTEHCIIARLDRTDFRALLVEVPKLSLQLIEHFVAIIRSMNERVTALTSLTPHQRIFTEFLRISEPNPNGDGTWVISVVPTHKEIASWSETNKSEVANAIGGLVRNGVMERHHRSFKIKDHTKLKLLAGLS